MNNDKSDKIPMGKAVAIIVAVIVIPLLLIGGGVLFIMSGSSDTNAPVSSTTPNNQQVQVTPSPTPPVTEPNVADVPAGESLILTNVYVNSVRRLTSWIETDFSFLYPAEWSISETFVGRGYDPVEEIINSSTAQQEYRVSAVHYLRSVGVGILPDSFSFVKDDRSFTAEVGSFSHMRMNEITLYFLVNHLVQFMEEIHSEPYLQPSRLDFNSSYRFDVTNQGEEIYILTVTEGRTDLQTTLALIRVNDDYSAAFRFVGGVDTLNALNNTIMEMLRSFTIGGEPIIPTNDPIVDSSDTTIAVPTEWVRIAEDGAVFYMPSIWTYQTAEDIYSPDIATIFGEGIGGEIQMFVWWNPVAPEMLEYGSVSAQDFLFDDTNLGRVIEFEDGITWLNDSWLGISFSHGGNRSVFTANEELITTIVRTLTAQSVLPQTPTADIYPMTAEGHARIVGIMQIRGDMTNERIHNYIAQWLVMYRENNDTGIGAGVFTIPVLYNLVNNANQHAAFISAVLDEIYGGRDVQRQITALRRAMDLASSDVAHLIQADIDMLNAFHRTNW